MFSLDIPSDASPAFQICVGTQEPPSSPATTPTPIPGGLEWKVRLCLLVGIASESSFPGTQGVRLKALVRDGPRGEWGSSWHTTPTNAPMEKPNLKAEAALQRQQQQQQLSSPKTWSQFFVSSILYGNASEGAEREYLDGDTLGTGDDDNDFVASGIDDGYDGIILDMVGGVGVRVDYAGGVRLDLCFE